MATETSRFAVHNTLTAATVDIITLTENTSDTIEVFNHSATGDIYFTVDGTTPVVAANDTYRVKPGSGLVVTSIATPDVVKLICATANEYSVTGAR